MAKTKKVKSSGKFGVRYGAEIKKKFLAIDKLKNEEWKCPSCVKPAIRRHIPGIWKCSKCGSKFAGKAYRPV